ncbi:hypothetical protein [Aliiroseovarius sp.]|uniref:hypothetical protein n=1 Tax=Aliiroseovarius sp. TaxID=1872442 RepID=UPI003BAD86DB
MTAQLGAFEQGVTRVSEAARGPRVYQTYWGYVVTEGDRAQSRGKAFERVGKVLGLGCVMAAAGLWLLPGALTGPDIVVMKLALTVGLMMAGAVLIWSAKAGFNDEMQVDLVRKELRVGQRNISGDYRLSAQVGFADIGSVFLMRSKKRGEPARLFLRIGNSDQALEVATGRADFLEPLRERLARDITKAARDELRLREVRRGPQEVLDAEAV